MTTEALIAPVAAAVAPCTNPLSCALSRCRLNHGSRHSWRHRRIRDQHIVSARSVGEWDTVCFAWRRFRGEPNQGGFQSAIGTIVETIDVAEARAGLVAVVVGAVALALQARRSPLAMHTPSRTGRESVSVIAGQC